MQMCRYDDANNHFSEFCEHVRSDAIHVFFSCAVNYFQICISKKFANVCPGINTAWDQNELWSKVL